jgi:type II secretory pathway component GspD/PulD (secretin)
LGYERIGNSILVANVEKLSTPTGLVTRVFDLQYVNGQEVKSMLEVLSKDISANATGNRVVIHASQSVVDETAEIIKQLDTKPPQVLLEARMVEVNTSDLKEVGVDWEKITKWNTVVTEGKQGSSQQGQIPQALNFLKLDETADYYRQAAAFEVTLDALITDGTARLLSNSKVVTLNGRAAEIFAGETVPVVITSLQSGGGAGGVLQSIQLEKIDVGVKLKITPYIGDGAYVTAVVEPEVSRITRFIGPDSDLPQTSTRRAKSLVRVRDGEKIYLGGLLAEEKKRTVKKVPLLGDIPLLGYFFRHYRDDISQIDLVIEITPHIVGDTGSALPVAPASDLKDGEE